MRFYGIVRQSKKRTFLVKGVDHVKPGDKSFLVGHRDRLRPLKKAPFKKGVFQDLGTVFTNFDIFEFEF